MEVLGQADGLRNRTRTRRRADCRTEATRGETPSRRRRRRRPTRPFQSRWSHPTPILFLSFISLLPLLSRHPIAHLNLPFPLLPPSPSPSLLPLLKLRNTSPSSSQQFSREGPWFPSSLVQLQFPATSLLPSLPPLPRASLLPHPFNLSSPSPLSHQLPSRTHRHSLFQPPQTTLHRRLQERPPRRCSPLPFLFPSRRSVLPRFLLSTQRNGSRLLPWEV